MIQNLFVLSGTGEVLIEKHWREKVKRSMTEVFWEEVSKATSHDQVLPIIATPKYYMVHTHRYGLFFLSTVRKEVAPLLVIETQIAIVDILLTYFNKKLNEQVLRENFSVVYQLLDEMVDGGFPSTTEGNTLKEMIKPPNLAWRLFQKLGDDDAKSGVTHALPMGALSKIPWRKNDVKYVQNQIYFDINESIDAIVSPHQGIIKAEVAGEIMCNCQLSGVPDLTLSLVNSNILDECSLHRCVRINRFQRDRVLSFVPPDGSFKLITYRVRGLSSLPVWVKPKIDYKKGGGRVHVTFGMNFNGRNSNISAEEVVVTIPFPKTLQSISLTCDHGVIKHDEIAKVLRWDIGKMPKDGKSPVLRGSVTFPQHITPDSAPVVSLKFNIKQMNVSGVGVDGLSIRGVSYKPFKGVRKVTRGGRFQVRSQ